MRQPTGLPRREGRPEFAPGHAETRRQRGPRSRNDPRPIPWNQSGPGQTERRIGRGELKPIRHLGQSPDDRHIRKQVGLIQWTKQGVGRKGSGVSLHLLDQRLGIGPGAGARGPPSPLDTRRWRPPAVRWKRLVSRTWTWGRVHFGPGRH